MWEGPGLSNHCTYTSGIPSSIIYLFIFILRSDLGPRAEQQLLGTRRPPRRLPSDLDPLHTLPVAYYKKQDVMRWKSFETQDLIEANCDTTAMSAMFLNYTPGFSSLFNYTGHWYPMVTAEIFLRAKSNSLFSS